MHVVAHKTVVEQAPSIHDIVPVWLIRWTMDLYGICTNVATMVGDKGPVAKINIPYYDNPKGKVSHSTLLNEDWFRDKGVALWFASTVPLYGRKRRGRQASHQFMPFLRIPRQRTAQLSREC